MAQKNEYHNLEVLLDRYSVHELLRWWGEWAKRDIPQLGYMRAHLERKHHKNLGINESECLFIDKIITDLMAVRCECLILKRYYYDHEKINDMLKYSKFKKSALYKQLDEARQRFWELLILKYAVTTDKDQEWLNDHLKIS